MGECTTFQAYVYDCPEGQRAAALAVLTGRSLSLDWGSMELTGELDLEHPYTDHYLPVGHASDIATELQAAVPGASFVIWEDPTGEYLGDLYAYTPELGEFWCECDSNGSPIWDRAAVAKAIKEIVATVEDLAADLADGVLMEELDKRVGGKPWFDRQQAATGRETGQ